MTQKNLLQSAGDGTAIPAGVVGETIQFTPNVAITCTNASTWYVSSSVGTLTPGVWLISGSMLFAINSGVNDVILSTISDNTTANSSSFTNQVGQPQARVQRVTSSGTSVEAISAISSAVVRVTANTNVFYKAFCEDSSSQVVTVTGFAVRLA